MGSGCRLLAGPAIALGGLAPGSPVHIPIPIPGISALGRASAFFRGLVFSPTAAVMEATPGLAVGFGF